MDSMNTADLPLQDDALKWMSDLVRLEKKRRERANAFAQAIAPVVASFAEEVRRVLIRFSEAFPEDGKRFYVLDQPCSFVIGREAEPDNPAPDQVSVPRRVCVRADLENRTLNLVTDPGRVERTLCIAHETDGSITLPNTRELVAILLKPILFPDLCTGFAPRLQNFVLPGSGALSKMNPQKK